MPVQLRFLWREPLTKRIVHCLSPQLILVCGDEADRLVKDQVMVCNGSSRDRHQQEHEGEQSSFLVAPTPTHTHSQANHARCVRALFRTPRQCTVVYTASPPERGHNLSIAANARHTHTHSTHALAASSARRPSNRWTCHLITYSTCRVAHCTQPTAVLTRHRTARTPDVCAGVERDRYVAMSVFGCISLTLLNLALS